MVTKDLVLTDVPLEKFFTATTLYTLCDLISGQPTLDKFIVVEDAWRMLDHEKTGADVQLNIYLYVIIDNKVNMEDGRFVSALY